MSHHDLPAPRRITRTWLIALAWALLGAPWGIPGADACSTFSIETSGRVIFGRNYDWDVDAGLIVVNRRGVEKSALPTGAGEPARWISRLGSVTFNQYGRELPLGGMNEAGLVIEVSWLEGTQYAAVDERPALSNLQWVQYQLDLHRTVAEVIASGDTVRIAGGGAARVHYLITDASGEAATIELIGGRRIVHTGATLPVAVLTNHPYAAALAEARAARGSDPPPGTGSLARFARLAAALETPAATGGDPVARAFELLDDVSDPRRTQWRIVYDQTARVIHLATRAHPTRRHLALDGLDFDCDTPVRVVDVQLDARGDLAPHLDEDADAANLALIRTSFRATDFLREVPDEALVALAGYPASLPCAGSR